MQVLSWTCARCGKEIGKVGNAVYVSSKLGSGTYCEACFKKTHAEIAKGIDTHKAIVRERRSIAARLKWHTKEIDMSKMILKFEIETETENLARILHVLGVAPVASGQVGVAAPKPAAEDAPKKAKKAKPEPEPVEEAEEEEEEEEGDDEEDEEEEDGELEEEEEAAPTAKPVKVTDDLRNATKLREVLDVLINTHKITSKKALVAQCLALRKKVPVLDRIQDLETRIPKAAELIDPNIKA